jgi:hypothetical protein
MKEPKAWINIEDGLSFLDWDKSTEAQESYPLYVMNELTDEEITEVLIEEGIYVKLKDGGLASFQEDADLHKLAISILKKAREK